ncbi:MAG TPA: GNAT family N-acetyltransferase [Tepidisphaeraceae bacterium]|nr:GNAT family N-acetyltransferase [Tepidisphaeraceae bacterium]
MDSTLLPGWGLRCVEASDAAALNGYFATLAEPLSDYTFSQIFTWRNSLRLLWRELQGHLCVFANGAGDLTLLLPPIGFGDAANALAAAFELMDDYNAQHHVPGRSRVEYTSEELLARLDPCRSRLSVTPMGHDYVYHTARMIDLAGGDLASKRQAKNRFMRNYGHRVETYRASEHLRPCLDLLGSWNEHQSQQHVDAPGTNAIKRQKELLATELALQHADVLGLTGIVVHVTGEDGVERVAGFTLGERLGRDQSSIVIEKTDLRVKGLAQFIFSEFCRLYWSDRALVNVGDDWGLQTLAWTKQSYRPVKLLKKYVVRQERAVMSASGFPHKAPDSIGGLASPEQNTERTADAIGGFIAGEAPVVVRTARPGDIAALAQLERSCFDAYQLTAGRLEYLQRSPRALVRVAESDGVVVGHAVALVRRSGGRTTGRLYSIAVDRARRGQGIGRQLLADAMAQLTSRGVTHVVLEVEGSNARAISLYERDGFAPVAVLSGFYGPGRDGLRMMRALQAQDSLRPAA